MNEQLWTVCDNPELMIAYLIGEGRFTAHKKQCFKDASTLTETLQDRANLLRCLFGNPWRPVTLPTSRVRCDWCNTTGEVMDGGSHGYNRTYETCPSCKGEGWRAGKCPWLTPTVVSLATAAYQERPGRRVCEKCYGVGYIHAYSDWRKHTAVGQWTCEVCHGTGRVEDGRLDNSCLAVLADALEDAECPETVECEKCEGTGKRRNPNPEGISKFILDKCRSCHGTGSVPNPILTHLRSDGVHVRGCWVLDALLGKA